MRALVALMLVAALLPAAAPGAGACHPDFTLGTPTSPGVGVFVGSSCSHRSHAVCALLDGSDLVCVTANLP